MPKPIVDDEDNCTVEERKALNEYYEYRRHNLSYYYVSSDIKFANLAVGDDFYDDEIIAIQKEIFKKVFKNMNLGTIFRVHPAFSMIKAFAKRDY